MVSTLSRNIKNLCTIIKSVFIFFALSLIFTSCVRNPETTVTDDIVSSVVSDYEGASYSINQESIFQITSSTSSGGYSRRSGFQYTRLSVYDLESGKLVARKKLSISAKKKTSIMLGCANGKVWMYTLNKKKGLYALQLPSLELAYEEDEILAKKPGLSEKLAQADYISIAKFFGFDSALVKVLVTDDQGHVYAIDPFSLDIEPYREKKFPDISRPSVSANSGILDGINIRLEGSDRKRVYIRDYDLYSTDEFIDAELIIDHDVYSLCTLYAANLAALQGKIDTVEAELKPLLAEIPDISPWHPDAKKRDAIYYLEKSLREYSHKQDTIKRNLESVRFNAYSYSLLSDVKSRFFIVHRNSVNSDAKLSISCLEISKGEPELLDKEKSTESIKGGENEQLPRAIKSVWTREMSELFFEQNKSEEFKKVYSKGEPSFSYQNFIRHKNRLVFTHLLYHGSIDLESGELVWINRL